MTPWTSSTSPPDVNIAQSPKGCRPFNSIQRTNSSMIEKTVLWNADLVKTFYPWTNSHGLSSAKESRQISPKTLVALEASFHAEFQRLIDRYLPSMKGKQVREAL